MPTGVATKGQSETVGDPARLEAWKHYNEWLTGQLDQKLFDGEVSLRQVYVPLRAYYEDIDQQKEVTFVARNVDFLHHAMLAWLSSKHRDDTLRIVCGGPGYGKSSFAKTLCEEVNQADYLDIRALYLPLHHLDLTRTNNVTGEINVYLKQWGFDFCDPFDRNESGRLLLVPDGLDELAMQGDAARQAAIAFVEQIVYALAPLNAVTPRVRCIVCGRDVMVQSVSNALQMEERVWHLLPYFLLANETQEDEVTNSATANENKSRIIVSYRDPKGLLNRDQRPEWWVKYAQATGRNYDDVPAALRGSKLDPITSLPLLNYLLALSYERAKIKFDSKSTRNEIYFDLIERIHERDWGLKTPRNVHTQGLSRQSFVRILETVAMVAWRSGDTRTARVEDIKTACKSLGLLSAWQKFESRAEEGLTRIFTAFYIRFHGFGHGVVEFSHKSFGDYLTARAIVNEWERLASKSGPKLPALEFLGYWSAYCGQSSIDPYILDFIRDEIALRERNVADWQASAAVLLQYVVDHDIQTNLLPEQLELTEANRRGRNAAEALLAVHSSCARMTLRSSEINWRRIRRMYLWLIQLQGETPDDRVVNSLLNHLTFGYAPTLLYARGLYLHDADLTGAQFDNVDLTGAVLTGARLFRTKWKSVILIGADLTQANLDGAEFMDVTLDGAMLRSASLVGANLQEVRLRNANLSNAELPRAQFTRAVLSGAILDEANMSNASIDGANLAGASFVKTQMANLSGVEARMASASLRNAVMTDVKLENANLSYAILREADLTRANLHGAQLAGADLRGAILENTRLENADLQGADLSTVHMGEKNSYWNGSIIDGRTKLPATFPHGAYNQIPHSMIPNAYVLRRRDKG